MRNSDCPIYNNPPRAEWPKLTARAAESDSDIESSVRTTLEYVRTKGDQALLDLESHYDGTTFVSAEALKVSEKESEDAAASVPHGGGGDTPCAERRARPRRTGNHAALFPRTARAERGNT